MPKNEIKIAIKTKLADGIYKSDSGGDVVTHATYKCSPRGLVMAINYLRVHRWQMVKSYGNIGCGKSWIEIGGVAFGDSAFCGIEIGREPGMSRTDVAREFLLRHKMLND